MAKIRKARRKMHLTDYVNRDLLDNCDRWLIILCIGMSLFGIVSIFSAASYEVAKNPNTVMEMITSQPLKYPLRQAALLAAALAIMLVILFIPYKVYLKYINYIYWGNIGVLLFTLLVAQVGRGAMKAFIGLGDSTFQPSEFGKVAIVLCLANSFASRPKPISGIVDLILMGVYMGLPMILVLLQPDFGTAVVYLFVFAVMVLLSGTDRNLLFWIISTIVILAIPAWSWLNNAENFRLTRILMWLHPEDFADEARQVINGQIAVGSGGIWGKGIVSVGSFASLGYISDDHTDFIFAVVCESFGLVGGCALIASYILLIARLLYHAIRIKDPFGSYIIIGAMSMLLFHILENICMVLGISPVTGIPLPFISYGGSNLITNFAAIGLVESVIIQNKLRGETGRVDNTGPIHL